MAVLLAAEGASPSRPPGMSPAQWTSALAELVREKVLIDRRSYDRILSQQPFGNRLGPVDMAVLRAFNEGGMKAARDGPPPPAARRPPRGRTHALTSRPKGEDLQRVAEWLAARQSIRTYSSQALARAQLEQFLELTGRAYATVTHPTLGTTSLRNYPSGGARYPLEIYPLLLNVASFGKGFYHYHPFHHRLEYLGRKPRYLDALRDVVRRRMERSADDPSEPAVLFVITAVASRVCWKYRGHSAAADPAGNRRAVPDDVSGGDGDGTGPVRRRRVSRAGGRRDPRAGPRRGNSGRPVRARRAVGSRRPHARF